MADEDKHKKGDEPSVEVTTPPAAEAQETDDSTSFDDEQTDRAIDDIAASDSDELLAAEDAGDDATSVRRGNLWTRWWHSKLARGLTLLVLLAGLITLYALPSIRYQILNGLGVQASLSVTVTDELTHQPLKNVAVQVAGTSAKTDFQGRAMVKSLALGPTTLQVTRAGFATHERKLTIGWGSNPQGTVALKAVGLQFTLQVNDYLTNKPITNAEVTSGDAVAVSDATGKAVITLATHSDADQSVTVTHDGYRPTTIVVKAQNTGPTPVALVTARKAVFVNKQSGKYDVYSSDADGQNKQIILAATGNESANISVVVSPDGSRAAVVSTRDNQRAADGTLLNALTLVTTSDGSNVNIAHAEQIRLIDWVGTRLVFEQVSPDATPVTAKYDIISYDYAANTRVQLATASKLNSVVSAQGSIYYALAADDKDPALSPGFFKVNPDGNGKHQVLDKEVWSAYRTDYNTLSLQTSDGWYSANLTSGVTTQVSAPAAYVSRAYIENPSNNGQSLWVDIRDGQGVLLRYDKASGKDSEAHRQSGLTQPVRWLTDDTAIFRVVTSNEAADYAVSTAGGGTAHKIADVISTYGFTAGQ